MLLNSDARSLPLADGCVQCVVTSPPYWNLRDYGIDNQIGLEGSIEEYVANMIVVFREVKRVLRDDGLVFLNLGDSYNGSGGAGGDYNAGGLREGQPKYPGRNASTLKPKDLCGIPWRVAFALQADGWYLRSDIIWNKPNPMPESLNGWRWEQHRVKVGVTDKPLKQTTNTASYDNISGGDGNVSVWENCPGCPGCEPHGGLVLRRGSWRPTKSHEYLFMLAKSDRYFADADAVREGYKTNDGSTSQVCGFRETPPGQGEHTGKTKERTEFYKHAGRNRRTVWDIATAPYSGAHFATFPPALVEPCIKAATSERGCCPACGASWARVVVHTPGTAKLTPKTIAAHHARGGNGVPSGSVGKAGSSRIDAKHTTLGFRPTCSCIQDGRVDRVPYDPVPSLVLDPFCGSGTTLLVARELKRIGVGTDLSFPYLRDQARKRLGLDKLAAWRDGAQEVETRLDELPLFEEIT